MKKPKESDFWDDDDPRGPSTREIDIYSDALKKYKDSISQQELKFYIVQNQEGNYYRNKGYDGHTGETKFDSSWVEDINKAKVYTKIGSAKGRVTYFYKNWPKYGKPKILIFTAKNTDII